MKKFIFIMPLMAVSFLASCGGSKPEPSVVYHTITFHSNGGSEVPVLKVEDGKLAVEPKDPAKVGLLFKGWYQEEALVNYFSFSTKITKDYDLYANWQSKYDFTVTLESEGMSTLEKNGGWLNQDDYKSEIYLNEDLSSKYELHASKGYYEVSVNGQVIKNFSIDKVDYSLNDYHVVITIPKEYLGENIVIKSVPYCHYLTFTGEADDSKIYYYSPEGTPSSPIDIEYCDDLETQNWQNWASGDENAITLKDDKKTIYVRNTQNTLSTSNMNYVSFNTGAEGSSNVLSSGNIMSLVNFSDLSKCCFYRLFRGCKSLTSAPVLPATTLAEGCYSDMFFGCSLLITASELPATTLASECYAGMFCDCLALVKAPVLPATTLAEHCYNLMFGYCSSLITAPELPATTLAEHCYCYMFTSCSSLQINKKGSGTKFFTCPSDITPEGCVFLMFDGTGGDITSDPEPNVTYYYG